MFTGREAALMATSLMTELVKKLIGECLDTKHSASFGVVHTFQRYEQGFHFFS